MTNQVPSFSSWYLGKYFGEKYTRQVAYYFSVDIREV